MLQLPLIIISRFTNEIPESLLFTVKCYWNKLKFNFRTACNNPSKQEQVERKLGLEVDQVIVKHKKASHLNLNMVLWSDVLNAFLIFLQDLCIRCLCRVQGNGGYRLNTKSSSANSTFRRRKMVGYFYKQSRCRCPQKATFLQGF